MPSVCMSVCSNFTMNATLRKNTERIFVKNLPRMYLRTKKNWLNFEGHPLGSGTKNLKKNFLTLRDKAFFHSLAHISGISDRVFIKILLYMYPQGSLHWILEVKFGFGDRIWTWFALAEVCTLRMLFFAKCCWNLRCKSNTDFPLLMCFRALMTSSNDGLSDGSSAQHCFIRVKMPGWTPADSCIVSPESRCQDERLQTPALLHQNQDARMNACRLLHCFIRVKMPGWTPADYCIVSSESRCQDERLQCRLLHCFIGVKMPGWTPADSCIASSESRCQDERLQTPAREVQVGRTAL